MEAGQKQAKRDRVQALDIHSRELQVGFIDPHAPVELRKKLCLFHMRHKSWTWFGVDYPRLACPNRFGAHQLEVVCVGNFGYELAIFFAFFLLALCTLSAIALGLVLTLVDDLFNLLFLLSGVFPGEWLVILLD